MPIIKRAIKKLARDRKITVLRKKTKDNLAGLVKLARKSPSKKTLSAAFSALDKAVKTNIVHKNKANRLKSRLSKRSK